MTPATQQNPLAQLQDIQLPDPVSWWPLAPGWWLLIFIALAIIVTTSIFLWRRHQHNAYRRQALKELSALDIVAENHAHDLNHVHIISTILRRTVKTAYPQQGLEALPLKTLLIQLDQYSGQHIFHSIIDSSITTALYQPSTDIRPQDIEQFGAATRRWIKSHRQHKPESTPNPSGHNAVEGNHANL